jgi:DNA (cytosine-5)-methyltransferase 1
LESAVHTKQTLFTYAELFAGLGGFGVALQALGGACVFCSELDEDCRALYTTNFPTTAAAHLHGDIYQVRDDQLPSTSNGLDLLVGGFPCQPFSRLGDQPGLADPRGQLFDQIVRVLRVSQPRAFLLENVPGLLSMPEAYQTIVTALAAAGYDVTTQVCNARGLTAASRKRLFFVGLRRNTTATTTRTSRPFEFPYVPDLGLRASHVIAYDKDAHGGDEDDFIFPISAAQLDRLVHANGRWKPAHLAWPDRVCDTLDAHYGNSIGKGNSQLVPRAAPLRPRRFSPRECARIMGFPASYQLPSLQQRKASQGEMAFYKQHYRMLGNAVCPPLVAALAGAVLGASLEDEAWVAWGRATAVQLAREATLQGPPHAEGSC